MRSLADPDTKGGAVDLDSPARGFPLRGGLTPERLTTSYRRRTRQSLPGSRYA
jgi:hypothetical protein